MRLYIVWLMALFVFCCQLVTAQNTVVDSLQRVIYLSTIDTVKANAYYELSYAVKDPINKIKYCDSALVIYEKVNHARGMVESLIELSKYYYNILENEKGLEAASKAEIIFNKNRNKLKKSLYGNIMDRKSRYYYNAQEYYVSAEYSLKAAEAFKAANNIKQSLVTRLNLSSIYNMLEENDKVTELCNEIYKEALALNDTVTITNALTLHVVNLMNTNKIESANTYLSILEKYLPYIEHQVAIQCNYYKGKATYEFNINKNTDNAIALYNKALSKTRPNDYNSIEQEADIYGQLANIYNEIGKYNLVLEYSQKAIDIKRNKLELKDALMGNLRAIGIAYSKLGRYNIAYNYLDSAFILKDSITIKKSLNDVKNLEKKYQLKEKNTEIENLQKENIVQRNMKIQYGITAIAALLSSLFLFLFLRNRKKLHAQTINTQQQKINQLEQEKQMASLEFLLKGQEEERTRLARDLHDGLGGMLSGMKISLSQMDDTTTQHPLHNVINQLDNSIKELRHIAHNMMPEALLKYGLDEALNNFCTSLNHNKQINITYQSYGWQNTLDKEKEVVLYRIAQELINNAIKHAQANNILVQVICDDKRINLTVEDDGIGYQKDALGGIGLKNIESRTQFINATFDVHSQLGAGTTCQVEVNLTNDINYAKN